MLEKGWKQLSAKETGRIGGLVTKRKRELSKETGKQVRAGEGPDLLLIKTLETSYIL